MRNQNKMGTVLMALNLRLTEIGSPCHLFHLKKSMACYVCCSRHGTPSEESYKFEEFSFPLNSSWIDLEAKDLVSGPTFNKIHWTCYWSTGNWLSGNLKDGSNHVFEGTFSIKIFNCQDINGEFIRGLPCVKRFNQLFCNNGGTEYPDKLINVFIDDNKALMRRMHGTLVEPVQEVEGNPQTPASTTFVKSVRSFRGLRFTRSLHEGYLEDLVLGSPADDNEEFWDNVLTHQNEFWVKNNISYPTSEEMEVFRVLARAKRQAGFPGSANKDDNKVDACESRVEVTTPFWATNSKGQVRAIVNNKEFEQAVHQEICTNTRTLRCIGDCECEQKYKWHRLLAYDPNNDCSGIFMDWFLFPSCCTCRCRKNPLLA